MCYTPFIVNKGANTVTDLNIPDDLSIPVFLKVENRTGVSKRSSGSASKYVCPVEQRQRELRAAQEATRKAERAKRLQKHLQNIADHHAGEEYNATLGCWERTDRAMAKLAAQHEAEFAQQEVA
jgi:hypothetical protein